MTLKDIQQSKLLDELLNIGGSDEYPSTFGRKPHIERYKELANKFANYPVEMGAMQETIKTWIAAVQEKTKEINSIDI